MGSSRIVIVGGGFAGASAAVQLARKIAGPLAITIIEPSADLGAGLAYSADDPAFRLNAISGAHSIDVADPAHFTRWCEAEGIAGEDPDARIANGELFVRRRDFRRYLADSLRDHSQMPDGTTIRHVQQRASDVVLEESGARIVLDDGSEKVADLAILSTGNPPLRRPGWVAGELTRHKGVLLDPLREGLETIPPEAQVLVVGAGLTALDIIASLLGRGHTGQITAISRRAFRPHAQAPRVLAPPSQPPAPPVVPLDLLRGELPDYANGKTLTALGLLRGLRKHAAQTEAEGIGWQAAFDLISMPLSRIWPKLPLEEKRRALRHLRPFYDAHRFRTPPMTDALVRAAESEGQVRFCKASLRNVSETVAGRLAAELDLPREGHERREYDAVINCTGFESASAIAANPLLATLETRGTIVPHPTGLGIETDAENRPVSADGTGPAPLRVIGPLTAGVFGDPLGVFFISAQIHRIIPGIAQDMGLTLF